MDDAASTKANMLSSPYFAIFYARGNALSNLVGTLNNTQQQHFQMLLNNILTKHESEYKLIDGITRKKNITYKYIKHLFKPGDVVVKGSDQSSRGYLCTTWLEEREHYLWKDFQTYTLAVRYWTFDGVFTRRSFLSTPEFKH
jgi:hypothetical protein